MKKKILVVDDSKVNRIVAATNLESGGYDVESVSGGAEAIALLNLENGDQNKPRPFDMVLLDVMMPEIDGIEVLEKIREVWSRMELPVIMATARDEPDDVVEALKSGANDYVTKPLNMEILQARVQTHLELKESHEALKKAQRALVNAGKMESVGILAAGVAHEIRNPLGRIEMAASGLDALVDSLPDDMKEIGQLASETIRESVEKADEIVLGLMKASQDQQLNLVPSSLDLISKRAVTSFKQRMKDAGITVSFEFDKTLPLVPLAEEEFFQALCHIVENAIQAMELSDLAEKKLTMRTEAVTLSGVGSKEGGRSGNRMHDGDSAVGLFIEDTGPGMDRRDSDRVFDAFFTTKATGVGTGLGLTVARKIIELHNGIIRLENREEPESGLRVSVFLKTVKGLRTSV